jgi:hypothetical protein
MFSPTLIRRYTPPTCSLEVAAKTSPLSQWTGKPLISTLKFELRFDDPRLGPGQRLIIAGDRQQLEALASAVTEYVQGFLQDFQSDFALVPEHGGVYGYQMAGANSAVATFPQPQLVTQGLLSHVLHLGHLATPESGPTLQLNATQLHDLAEALETYSSDMVVLPSLAANQQRRAVTRWGAIAASLLLAVGVGRTVWQQQAPESNTLSLETIDERSTQLDLIPPNPHASYTFAPLPTAEAEALNLQPVAPQTIDFTQAPPPRRPSTPSAASQAPTLPPSIAVAPRSGLSGPEGDLSAAQRILAEPFAETSGTEPEAIATAPQFAPSLNSQQQVEQHFQAQWQSPADLGQVLEYRLQLNGQGTIQSVFPIGKAAELYQPQLSFLAIGQSVNLSSEAGGQTFRLVLNPNGRVQVFSETPR